MQAVRFHDYGGLEQLQLEEVPIPQPQAREVLVQVHAAGVQPADWKIRQGQFKSFRPATFPVIPGSPFAGIVEATGPGVTGFQKGQAVFGRSDKGTYAEYTVAPVETTALKPEALNFEEAVTIPAGAATAWMALFEGADLQPGQRVLILGAAGGVGLYAVQLARWKGARVTATTSTTNLDFVRSLGAESVIDYTTADLEQEAHDMDLVIDAVGGGTLERAMNVIKPGGAVLTILGRPPQEKAQERNIIIKSIPGPLSRQVLESVAHLMEAGQIKSVVGKKFKLSEARQAQELSETGHVRGRIVLIVR